MSFKWCNRYKNPNSLLPTVYDHAAALARLHPKNLHVRDKIRQQLQVLRNFRLLDFLGPGHYRLR